MEHDTTSAPTAGRGRVLAFRIVAGIFGALLILLNASFGLSPLFNEADKVHSFHQIGPLFFYTLLVGLPLIMLAIHPADVTALRVAWAAVLGPVIASLMGQDFLSGAYYLAPIVLLVLTVLAPTRGQLLRLGSPNIAMLSLALISAIPAIVYAWDNARIMLQGDPATDVTGHWEFHHWSGIAGVALGLVCAAAVGAFRQSGDRMWVWLIGITAMLFGLTGIVYSDDVRYPSSFGVAWGVLVLFLGLVYIAVGELSGRDVETTRAEVSPA